MTREDIDKLWQQALHESIAKGEAYTRYRFAELVCAKKSNLALAESYRQGYEDGAVEEQDRVLRVVYEQLAPYGKTGECAWIGVKHNVRKK